MATKLGDITLNKQEGTILNLSTQGKYVADDVFFNIGVKTGAATVTVASTDATIESESNNRNISGAIGIKSTSAPVSGYYFKIAAAGTGESTVTTAGWLSAGSLGTATASRYFYFPVDTATATVAGTNTVTPSASISGSNITLSNTNNGIAVIATGGGTASANVIATGSTAGYVPTNGSLGSNTINSSNISTTTTSYISGVTLTTPSSGFNTFTVTMPNGTEQPITFTFTVDANGNGDLSVDADNFDGYVAANTTRF